MDIKFQFLVILIMSVVFLFLLRKINSCTLESIDDFVAVVIANYMISIVFWIGPILFVVYNGMKYLKNFQFEFGFFAGNLIIILVLNYLLMAFEPYFRWRKQIKEKK